MDKPKYKLYVADKRKQSLLGYNDSLIGDLKEVEILSEKEYNFLMSIRNTRKDKLTPRQYSWKKALTKKIYVNRNVV